MSTQSHILLGGIFGAVIVTAGYTWYSVRKNPPMPFAREVIPDESAIQELQKLNRYWQHYRTHGGQLPDDEETRDPLNRQYIMRHIEKKKMELARATDHSLNNRQQQRE